MGHTEKARRLANRYGAAGAAVAIAAFMRAARDARDWADCRTWTATGRALLQLRHNGEV